MKYPILMIVLFIASFSALGQESTSTPQKTSLTSASDMFEAQFIPRNSKVYIAPMKSEDASKPVEGFETYLAAALRKKQVPLLIVIDRDQADFEIVGTADKKGAGWAKKVFFGKQGSSLVRGKAREIP
jgi:hypothetical protein